VFEVQIVSQGCCVIDVQNVSAGRWVIDVHNVSQWEVCDWCTECVTRSVCDWCTDCVTVAQLHFLFWLTNLSLQQTIICTYHLSPFRYLKIKNTRNLTDWLKFSVWTSDFQCRIGGFKGLYFFLSARSDLWSWDYIVWVTICPPKPATARSEAWVLGLTPAVIAGSNPTRAWMFVYCECCVLSGRCHCLGLITCSEESYWVWCVWVGSRNLNGKDSQTHECCRVVRRKRSLRTHCPFSFFMILILSHFFRSSTVTSWKLVLYRHVKYW